MADPEDDDEGPEVPLEGATCAAHGDRPAFRDKPFGKPGFGKGGERGEGREKRAPEPPKSRKSNVWMAPGARPQGKSETKRTPSKGGKGSGPRSSSPRRPRKD